MQSNEPTIEQMDKAIAEFMELETDNEPHLAHRRTVYLVNGYWYPLRKLKYNTSWDWLMPVIKKIKGMHLDILNQPHVLGYMKAAGAMNSGLITLEIDKAHKGVYEFLIWYNQNKPNAE